MVRVHPKEKLLLGKGLSVIYWSHKPVSRVRLPVLLYFGRPDAEQSLRDGALEGSKKICLSESKTAISCR